MKEEVKFVLSKLYHVWNAEYTLMTYFDVLILLLNLDERDTADLLNDVNDERDMDILSLAFKNVRYDSSDHYIFKSALIGIEKRFQNSENEKILERVNEAIKWIHWFNTQE